MGARSISRRDILKTLALGTTAGSALQIIPLEAAAHVHAMVMEEKAQSPSGTFDPKFFSAHQYKTLQALCQMIIPSDDGTGGAIEAGAPEFIDLLTSENQDYQLTLGGGLMWLDSTCQDRYGKAFLESSADQQREILDAIAYRQKARTEPSLAQGIHFFSFLRDLTTDGFFTSEIGIKYLQYIGNDYLPEFPGCPPVPGV
jgi:gluconate 2-dehydrogenase gamma chain